MSKHKSVASVSHLRRPRDAAGFRVPRKGTLSWDVYKLLSRQLSAGEIAARLGADRTVVRVLMYKIRNPERSNDQQWFWNAERER